MRKVSVLIVLLVMALIVIGITKVNRIERRVQLTITGSAGGQDSIVTDTTVLFQSEHFRNRVLGMVILDSVTQHTAGVTNSFGLADTVRLVLKSVLNGQYITLDSTGKTMTSATTCTLFVNNTIDSVYGERVVLITRIADSIGVDTDSIVRFNLNVKLLHGFQD